MNVDRPGCQADGCLLVDDPTTCEWHGPPHDNVMKEKVKGPYRLIPGVGEKQRRDGACHVTGLLEFLSTLFFLAFSNDEQGSRPPAPYVRWSTNLEEILRPPRTRA